MNSTSVSERLAKYCKPVNKYLSLNAIKTILNSIPCELERRCKDPGNKR